MFDLFPIMNGLKKKKGDSLSPLLCNFELGYAIRRIQPNQCGLKLKITLQIQVNVDVVNILGSSIHTLKENAEDGVFASKEMGLEVNADKTKCVFMSRDQNAGRSHNVKTDSKSFERMEKFKYFGTTVTNQNSIQEEIKGRLRSGNTCYHSVQTPLSASLLSKNI